MKKLMLAAAAAALLSAPVVSAYAYPDAEIQNQLDWQAVVDQANAHRLGTPTIQTEANVAAVKPSQANDAAQATKSQAAPSQPNGHYTSVQSIRDDN